MTDYTLKPIRTDSDYRAALDMLVPYFDHEPETDSDTGAHFEALVTLVEAYEAKHYPVAHANLFDAIKLCITG